MKVANGTEIKTAMNPKSQKTSQLRRSSDNRPKIRRYSIGKLMDIFSI